MALARLRAASGVPQLCDSRSDPSLKVYCQRDRVIGMQRLSEISGRARRFALALMAALALVMGMPAALAIGAQPAYAAQGASASEQEAYERIVALRAQYPEGMRWTNDDYYLSPALYQAGYGCHAFALILSDAAFGSNPGTTYEDLSQVRVGDILRVNYDTHTVVVLEVRDGGVVVAEGNYNASIHWGRVISFGELSRGFMYGITRYVEPEPEPDPEPDQGYYGFSDIHEGEWYTQGGLFEYAVDHGLMSGYTDSDLFGTYDPITRGQVAVILHRMAGEPTVAADPFDDVDEDAYYAPAIAWARATGVINGYRDENGAYTTFGPDEPVTREQLAVMLCNYASRIAGLDVSSGLDEAASIPGWENVSEWARPAMGWIVDRGIMSGKTMEDGSRNLDPQGSAWRVSMATMVATFHQML